MLFFLVKKMDEIIKNIKQSSEVKKQIKEGLLALSNENFAIKNLALKKAYSQQVVYGRYVEVTKELMLEQQDQIEILECENIELKNIIGDDKISTDVMNKVFKKVHSQERSEKERKLIDNLIRTNNRMQDLEAKKDLEKRMMK